MLKILVMVVGLGLGLGARAFQLDEHDRVMQQAYAEFTACYPQFARSLNVNWLVDGDRDEDLNLLNKELFFSHYYHPRKNLRMWRQDSAGRLLNLQPGLAQCRQKPDALTFSDAFTLAHAFHHFQDMAVPAHVVPVKHAFWDGFENYRVAGDIASTWSCEQIAAGGGDDMALILQQTAETTLAAIASLHLAARNVTRDEAQVYGGVDFWRENSGDGFGAYGNLGNHFGDEFFNQGGEAFEISGDVYAAFKREQLRLAVRATLRGLSSVLLGKQNREPVATAPMRSDAG